MKILVYIPVRGGSKRVPRTSIRHIRGTPAFGAALEANTKRALAALAGDPAQRAILSQRGQVLVDGQGAMWVTRAILDPATNTHP